LNDLQALPKQIITTPASGWRCKAETCERDEGPDFCIQKGRRKIWVEVIAPSPGDENNLDKVPDLFASGADKEARRKIELRIASALKTKADKFARYREKGIIGPKDSCVVAIAASEFALEAEAERGAGLPLPVTTVFPFGEEVVAIDPETAEFAKLTHKYSGEIERAEKEGKNPEAVARTGGLPLTSFLRESATLDSEGGFFTSGRNLPRSQAG
jgi:hypothetical protein